jgi:hypothetical protein
MQRLAALEPLVDAETWEKLGSQPLSLDIRLTPMTPRHESGAAIDGVTGLVWMRGSGPKWPDGMYYLSNKPTWHLMMNAQLVMSFPTEPGQMYVADCRVMAYETGPYRDGEVMVYSPRSVFDKERRKITDGHLLDVFVAKGEEGWYWLEPVEGDGLAFWGCDFGKVADPG